MAKEKRDRKSYRPAALAFQKRLYYIPGYQGSEQEQKDLQTLKIKSIKHNEKHN